MTFQIEALDYAQFAPLFALAEDELRSRNATRMTAKSKPGYPCRVSLEDADIGETLILVNYAHLKTKSPYASTHAVFVREGAVRAQPAPGEVPTALSSRLLSVRAFNRDGFMVFADVVEGLDLARALDDVLEDSTVDFVDIHNARQGCFAARCVRA